MGNAKSVSEVVVPTYASTHIVYVSPLFYTLAHLGLKSFIILNMQAHLKYAKAVGVSTSLCSYWDEAKGKIREVSWLSHQLTFLCPHVQSESHLGLWFYPPLGNLQIPITRSDLSSVSHSVAYLGSPFVCFLNNSQHLLITNTMQGMFEPLCLYWLINPTAALEDTYIYRQIHRKIIVPC